MRPSHVPTEATRTQAQTASGMGMPQDQIAILLGIDPKTLRKHYKLELARGSVVACMQVATSLFRSATTGDTTAAIWWTKCRMGWKDSTKVEQVMSGSMVTVNLSEEEFAKHLKRLNDEY